MVSKILGNARQVSFSKTVEDNSLINMTAPTHDVTEDNLCLPADKPTKLLSERVKENTVFETILVKKNSNYLRDDDDEVPDKSLGMNGASNSFLPPVINRGNQEPDLASSRLGDDF